MPITGQNARRSLFGAGDLKSGRRVFLARAHQRLADFHAFLRRLRAGAGRAGALWLLLDNHGSHKGPSSVELAAKLNIRFFWLPKQCPELNPVDHLWGGLGNRLAANRQFPSVDDQARHTLAWLHRLSPTQTLGRRGWPPPGVAPPGLRPADRRSESSRCSCAPGRPPSARGRRRLGVRAPCARRRHPAHGAPTAARRGPVPRRCGCGRRARRPPSRVALRWGGRATVPPPVVGGGRGASG